MNNNILNTDGNSQSYGLLELSAKVEYAMLALLELAINHGKKVTLTINDIAAKQYQSVT
jgi:bacteriorhodopsin